MVPGTHLGNYEDRPFTCDQLQHTRSDSQDSLHHGFHVASVLHLANLTPIAILRSPNPR